VRLEVVVVVPPFRQDLASMAKAGEQRLVQAFVTQSSVEALDESRSAAACWLQSFEFLIVGTAGKHTTSS
jgi:hypothetical protein